MGIDAEIMIRYRGEKPSDEQLTRWSWDLASAIGASKFFIEDGTPPDGYDAAIKQWHAAFNAHAEYPRYAAGDRSARVAIVADIGEAPKCLRRAIELTNREYGIEDDEEIPIEYRVPGRAWQQDGDPILAQPSEWLLKVRLWSRYYGVGYERGDLLTICAVAEWIEQNMQPCEVWYGGDSSGVLMEPFTEAVRRNLRAHLYSQQGKDYFQYEPRGTFPTPKPCGLCVAGENRFDVYGWGASSRVHCNGCGKNFESRDQVVTWKVLDNED